MKTSMLLLSLSYAILSSSHSSRTKRRHRDSKKLCYCWVMKKSWGNSMRLMPNYFLNRQGMKEGKKLILGLDSQKENREWIVMHLCSTRKKITCFIILLKLHRMLKKGWKNIRKHSNKKWWNLVLRNKEGCNKNRSRNSWEKSSPSKFCRKA